LVLLLRAKGLSSVAASGCHSPARPPAVKARYRRRPSDHGAGRARTGQLPWAGLGVDIVLEATALLLAEHINRLTDDADFATRLITEALSEAEED
jgi:hypothetical protein